MTAVTSSTPQWETVNIAGLEKVPEIGFVAFQQKASAVQNQYLLLAKQSSTTAHDAAKFTKSCDGLSTQADSFKELLQVTNSVGTYNMRVQTLFFAYQQQLQGEKNQFAKQLSTTYRTICWKFI